MKDEASLHLVAWWKIQVLFSLDLLSTSLPGDWPPPTAPYCAPSTPHPPLRQAPFVSLIFTKFGSKPFLLLGSLPSPQCMLGRGCWRWAECGGGRRGAMSWKCFCAGSPVCFVLFFFLLTLSLWILLWPTLITLSTCSMLGFNIHVSALLWGTLESWQPPPLLWSPDVHALSWGSGRKENLEESSSS